MKTNIDFEIEKLVPHFILNDRNGYALSKAIERAFQIAAKAAEDGLNAIQNADEMPEWRLDEMAKEYNIPYDYTAPIEVKRKWIREAYALSRSYGTAEGVSKYLSGYYDDTKIVEAGEYGGEPYHFTVELYGAWTRAKQAWVLKAISETKNVRSVLDSITQHLPDIEARHNIYVGLALYGAVHQWFDKTEMPDISGDYLCDEAENALMDENGVALTE